MSSSLTPRPSASTSAPQSPPMRAYMTNCGSCTQGLPVHGKRAIRQATFHTTPVPLRCPGCDGTGVVGLDVQFLPDVNIPCPDCRGSRYARAAYGVKLAGRTGAGVSLPELMDMDVNSAIEFCRDMKTVSQRLNILKAAWPWLPHAGRGDAEPLRRRGAAFEAGKRDPAKRRRIPFSCSTSRPSACIRWTCGCCWAFSGASGQRRDRHRHRARSDVIRNADYVIDMGPGGGDAGGRIVACGTPQEIQRPRGAVLPGGIW